jgi:coniferyl-aldehyde dehydrogenase
VQLPTRVTGIQRNDKVQADPKNDQNPVAEMLGDALKRQRAAYLMNPVPSADERRADLLQLERFLQDNRQAIIEAISADFGHRSAHETLLIEITSSLAGIRQCRDHVAEWMKPQRRHIDRMIYGFANNEVIPQPLGVIGVIVPWNFPLLLTIVPLANIFAAGNRAMVKMSENSRHLCALLMRKFPEYFPPEKLQVFDETGGVGIEFSRVPFDHIIFTGSGPTGRAVMRAAADNLCPVTLELGGKAPAIVCDDFELDVAAERILFAKYTSAGQICTTVDHAYLPEGKIAAFIELAQTIVPRRYGTLDSLDYTSIINRASYDRLVAALDEVRARGAQVIPLLPGNLFDEARHRIAPHIVVGAPMDTALMRDEIFGPILPLIGYQDLGEVISRINAGPRPLALYPFSHDDDVVSMLIERVMSGGVSVNDAIMHVGQDDLPFGGVGESGMGHYHGYEGFLTFSKLRPIFRQARRSPMQLLMPPYGKRADRLLAFLNR